MEPKINMLIGEFKKALDKVPGDPDKLRPTHIRILADLGAVIGTIQLIDKHSGPAALSSKAGYSLEDCIIDELSGAEHKHLEYIKNQDPAILNMAKDELRHAGYYLSQAKMTQDPSLLQRLRDYYGWYEQIEANINKPLK